MLCWTERVFEIPQLPGGTNSLLDPPGYAGHSGLPAAPCSFSWWYQGGRACSRCATSIQPARTWPPEAGRIQSSSSPWACNCDTVSARWAEEKKGGLSGPLTKAFIYLFIIFFSKGCGCMKAFLSFTQTCVYMQHGSPQQRRGFFRRFSPKCFFEAAVRLKQLTTKNVKPEVKRFDLARARCTSQAGSTQQSEGFVLSAKTYFCVGSSILTTSFCLKEDRSGVNFTSGWSF